MCFLLQDEAHDCVPGICCTEFGAHDVASFIASVSGQVRLHLASALVDYSTASKAKNTVQRKAEFFASFKISAAQLAQINAGVDQKTALGMISSWAAVVTTNSGVLLGTSLRRNGWIYHSGMKDVANNQQRRSGADRPRRISVR